MPELGGLDSKSNLCQCNSDNNPAILTCEKDEVKFVVRHESYLGNKSCISHTRIMCGQPKTKHNLILCLCMSVLLATVDVN